MSWHRLVSEDGEEVSCLTCGSRFASDAVADAVDCRAAEVKCDGEDGCTGPHYFTDAETIPTVTGDDYVEGSHCEFCGVWA